MIFDPSNFLQELNLSLLIKIALLTMIALYAIFSFMLANKIRSFNKILFLPTRSGGNLMQIITLLYSGAILVLFTLAIIII